MIINKVSSSIGLLNQRGSQKSEDSTVTIQGKSMGLARGTNMQALGNIVRGKRKNLGKRPDGKYENRTCLGSEG